MEESVLSALQTVEVEVEDEKDVWAAHPIVS